jgi:hypothetical protein
LLIALVVQPSDIQNKPPRYSLSVYQFDKTGKLSSSAPIQISPASTMNGFTPTFITSWKTSVYVVLTSSAQGNQNIVRVLSYTLDAKGRLSQPKPFDFSVSNMIVSAAAFPDQQLFLLQNNGSVLSFQVPVRENQHNLSTPVQVNSPIPSPLSVSAQDFTSRVNVPVALSAGQQGTGPLTVTGISTLSAGQVDNVTHLYVGDSSDHRVLDLTATPKITVGGPTPTPTAASTPAASGQAVSFQLVNQFVSSNNFTQLKSIAVQPNSSQLDVLAQNTSGQNLVAFDTKAPANCPP